MMTIRDTLGRHWGQEAICMFNRDSTVFGLYGYGFSCYGSASRKRCPRRDTQSYDGTNGHVLSSSDNVVELNSCQWRSGACGKGNEDALGPQAQEAHCRRSHKADQGAFVDCILTHRLGKLTKHRKFMKKATTYKTSREIGSSQVIGLRLGGNFKY